MPFTDSRFCLLPFLCPIYYLGLNLLKDSCKKGSELIDLVSALLCPGTHIIVTWFTSDSVVSFFI